MSTVYVEDEVGGDGGGGDVGEMGTGGEITTIEVGIEKRGEMERIDHPEEEEGVCECIVYVRVCVVYLHDICVCVPLSMLCLQDIMYSIIRESVDSLCRDGTDTPMPPYIHVGKAFTRTNVEDISLFSI